jgi:hypothetical protein
MELRAHAVRDNHYLVRQIADPPAELIFGGFRYGSYNGRSSHRLDEPNLAENFSPPPIQAFQGRAVVNCKHQLVSWQAEGKIMHVPYDMVYICFQLRHCPEIPQAWQQPLARIPTHIRTYMPFGGKLLPQAIE